MSTENQKSTEYQKAIEAMTPDIVDNMRRAVELGRWPDGKKLSTEQKEHCLQAIIAYDALHKPENERVGHIHNPKHDPCGSDKDAGHDDPTTLNWVK